MKREKRFWALIVITWSLNWITHSKTLTKTTATGTNSNNTGIKLDNTDIHILRPYRVDIISDNKTDLDVHNLFLRWDYLSSD